MFMFVSGVAFCVAWLIFVIIAASANDEPAAWLWYFVFGLPLAQAATFMIYRSTRNKQIIGGTILAGMVVIIATGLLMNNGPFMMLFFVVAVFNFVVYILYERLQSIARSVEPYKPN